MIYTSFFSTPGHQTNGIINNYGPAACKGTQVNHQNQKIRLYHSNWTNTEYNTWLQSKFSFCGIDLFAVLSTRKAKVVRSLCQCAPLQPKIFFMYKFYHFYECLTRDVVLSGCIPTEQCIDTTLWVKHKTMFSSGKGHSGALWSKLCTTFGFSRT